MTDRRLSWNRRAFLRGATLLSGAGLLGVLPRSAAAEPPPEITTIKISHDPDFPTLCYGPQYVAEELFKLEGFTDVQYVKWPIARDAEAVALGHVDIGGAWAGDVVVRADEYDSVAVISGMHAGCAEVFGGERVREFRDLKGKRVAIGSTGDIPHIFFSLIVSYIGMDPNRDVEWVRLPYDTWGEALSSGQVDAILLWPPAVQIYKENKIGHVIWNMTTDKPWWQYFCCMVVANRRFVDRYPVATKRALRALLKATDMCALQPQRAAQALVDGGFPIDYERALQVFQEVPYGNWREYDPVDTLRFYALRLHEINIIKKSPGEIIAQSGDWRFLDQLKRELKV